MANNPATGGMGRRQFLVLSSTCVVAAAALGSDLLPGAAGDAADPLLSVGYAAPGIAPYGGGRFSPNLMSADKVGSADGSFIRTGVRISAYGPPREAVSNNGRHFSRFELVTYFTVQDGAQSRQVPFRTWMYSRDTNQRGAPVRFYVPVDEQQRVSLGLFVDDKPVSLAQSGMARRGVLGLAAPSTPSADDGTVDLTMLSGSQMPKLRRGFYVIAATTAADAPRWDSIELRRGENGWVLVQMNGLDAQPVQWDYVILAVDYEDAAAKGGRGRITGRN